MSDKNSLFERTDGAETFRGLPVEHWSIYLGGRTFEIVGMRDAASLLDLPDYAKRFVEDDVAPYGLELWPAARMLAERILQDEDGCDRTAIELGCGLGLVSMAASAKGWQITATDNELTSLRFAEHNANVNRVRLAGFELLDWHHPPADRRVERIFAADVLYQRVDQAPMLTCVDRLLEAQGVALIADPNRGVGDQFASMAKEHGFEVDLHTAAAPNNENKTVQGRIFELRRPE